MGWCSFEEFQLQFQASQNHKVVNVRRTVSKLNTWRFSFTVFVDACQLTASLHMQTQMQQTVLNQFLINYRAETLSLVSVNLKLMELFKRKADRLKWEMWTFPRATTLFVLSSIATMNLYENLEAWCLEQRYDVQYDGCQDVVNMCAWMLKSVNGAYDPPTCAPRCFQPNIHETKGTEYTGFELDSFENLFIFIFTTHTWQVPVL